MLLDVKWLATKEQSSYKCIYIYRHYALALLLSTVASNLIIKIITVVDHD